MNENSSNSLPDSCEDRSSIYFLTPSISARNLLYYPLYVGEYYCSQQYRVSRSTYPSFLMAFIENGCLIVNSRNCSYTAQAGDVVLLNCYEPHEYYAASQLHFLWVHFDGAQSNALYEQIFRSRGTVFSADDPDLFQTELSQLIALVAKQDDVYESMLSSMIYSLLCQSLMKISFNTPYLDNATINQAILYFQEHMTEQVSVEDVAAHCAVSPSHFSRVFKKTVGYSPHEYLLKLRIDLAKQLLLSNKRPLSEVAIAVGFSDPCSFIYTFKSRVGMTPNSFRKHTF